MIPASSRAASLLPLLLVAAVDAQNSSYEQDNHNFTDSGNYTDWPSPPADAPCAHPQWVPAGGIAPEEFMWLSPDADAWEGPLPAGLQAPTAGWFCPHPNPCADVYVAEATCDIREVLALAGELVARPGYAPATDDPRLAVYCACRAVISSSDARPVAAASCAGSGRAPGTEPELWAAVLMNSSAATAAFEAAEAALANCTTHCDTAAAAAFVAAAVDSDEAITCPNGAAFDGNRTVDHHCTDEGEIDNEAECNQAGADGCIDSLGQPCHWEHRFCNTYVGYFRGIWFEGEASQWWEELPGIVEQLDDCCRP